MSETKIILALVILAVGGGAIFYTMKKDDQKIITVDDIDIPLADEIIDDVTFTEHKNVDSHGGDYAHLINKTPVELKVACQKNTKCKAYNSSGWLKSSLREFNDNPQDGFSLFVKNS